MCVSGSKICSSKEEGVIPRLEVNDVNAGKAPNQRRKLNAL